MLHFCDPPKDMILNFLVFDVFCHERQEEEIKNNRKRDPSKIDLIVGLIEKVSPSIFVFSFVPLLCSLDQIFVFFVFFMSK